MEVKNEELFLKAGPVMIPIILFSVMGLTVVFGKIILSLIISIILKILKIE